MGVPGAGGIVKDEEALLTSRQRRPKREEEGNNMDQTRKKRDCYKHRPGQIRRVTEMDRGHS